MRPFRIVAIADLHVGSSVALWPPKIPLPDGGHYNLSKAQRFLLDCWKDASRRVRRLKPDVITLLGDAVQGTSIRDGQLVTNRTDIQALAAYQLLKPWRECTKRFYMVKGTPWHEGKASEALGLLSEMLEAEKDPATKQRGWWEINLQLPGGSGPVVNLSHHLGATRVSWYEVTTLLRDMLMKRSEEARWYGAEGLRTKLFVRAHRHRCAGVFVAPDLQAYTIPAWQLRTAYAFKRSIVTLPHIGYMVVEWDGKDILVKPRLYTIPLPHTEEVVRAD